jgi:hypothetical protein
MDGVCWPGCVVDSGVRALAAAWQGTEAEKRQNCQVGRNVVGGARLWSGQRGQRRVLVGLATWLRDRAVADRIPQG